MDDRIDRLERKVEEIIDYHNREAGARNVITKLLYATAGALGMLSREIIDWAKQHLHWL